MEKREVHIPQWSCGEMRGADDILKCALVFTLRLDLLGCWEMEVWILGFGAGETVGRWSEERFDLLKVGNGNGEQRGEEQNDDDDDDAMSRKIWDSVWMDISESKWIQEWNRERFGWIFRNRNGNGNGMESEAFALSSCANPIKKCSWSLSVRYIWIFFFFLSEEDFK